MSSMNMAKLVVCVALCLGAFYVARHYVIAVKAQADVSVAPVIMTTQDFVVQNGKEVLTMNSTLERRNDGATNDTGQRMEGDLAGTTLRKIEMPDGFEGMIVDQLQLKSTGFMSSEKLAGRKALLTTQRADCIDPGEILDAKETLMGEQANRLIRITSTLKDTRELTWKLPAFGCIVGQMYVQKMAADGTWQTFIGKRLLSIRGVDPPSDHFAGWETYKELGPSDIKRAVLAAKGITASGCPKCYEDDVAGDKLYAAAQRR
jgi:hypothetical protein